MDLTGTSWDSANFPSQGVVSSGSGMGKRPPLSDWHFPVASPHKWAWSVGASGWCFRNESLLWASVHFIVAICFSRQGAKCAQALLVWCVNTCVTGCLSLSLWHEAWLPWATLTDETRGFPRGKWGIVNQSCTYPQLHGHRLKGAH